MFADHVLVYTYIQYIPLSPPCNRSNQTGTEIHSAREKKVQACGGGGRRRDRLNGSGRFSFRKLDERSVTGTGLNLQLSF